jgi:hypothetical protein
MELKRCFWWLMLNGGFAGAVWFGFVEGVHGAQYVAKFWIWAVAVPLGLMALTESMQKKLATEQPTPVRAFVQRVIAWGALGVLIWHGHIATATAWAFWMLAAAVCQEGVKKKRAEASAPSAA